VECPSSILSDGRAHALQRSSKEGTARRSERANTLSNSQISAGYGNRRETSSRDRTVLSRTISPRKGEISMMSCQLIEDGARSGLRVLFILCPFRRSGEYLDFGPASLLKRLQF